MPPADTHGRGGSYEEHVCFPLAQGVVKQPVPRPAGCRLTRQSDRQLVDAVEVSAVMIDVIPEPVDNPVHTSLAGANSICTNNAPPFLRQMASEDDFSMEEEVVVDLKFVILWSEDRPLRP